jgi:hypothetical protein
MFSDKYMEKTFVSYPSAPHPIPLPNKWGEGESDVCTRNTINFIVDINIATLSEYYNWRNLPQPFQACSSQVGWASLHSAQPTCLIPQYLPNSCLYYIE